MPWANVPPEVQFIRLFRTVGPFIDLFFNSLGALAGWGFMWLLVAWPSNGRHESDSVGVGFDWF
ncbi:hypothetical protein L208DRAFT_485425 [Tricholoma matsutake]|nr:hypothetical protein L208DRAFT_485425 [Tricholoma matsutake 945]